MNTSLEDGVVSADPVVEVVLGRLGTAFRAIQRDDQCEGELKTKDVTLCINLLGASMSTG